MLDLRTRARAGTRLGVVATTIALAVSLLPVANVMAAGETLAFTTPPAGATGGIAFTTQPLVTISPANAGGTVSLAIGNNPSSGTLSGCATPAYDSSTGTFAFSGCRIDKAGNGYTLIATWNGPGNVHDTSVGFNVAVGPAAQLVFTQQPVGNVGIGVNLPTQPSVSVTDAGGNVRTADTATQVTLAIKSGTPTTGGPGVLACTTNPVTVAAGVAAFAGCKINNDTGAAYQLRATSGALTPADSSAFNIVAGAGTKLAFTTQPGGGIAGTAWTLQPVVQVQDASSDVVVTDNTTVVTLAIGTNPGAGTLTCTSGLSRTVVNGQATFAGCSIDKVGTNYTLVATASPAYTSATSTVFNITLGTGVKLGFTSQPGASTINVPFTIQPVVAIQDAGGNTLTTVAVTTVTLGLGANPGAGTLTCTGGLTRTTSLGVATFSGCSINNAGVGYTLVASATGYASATSTAFTVGAPTASASITITTSAPMPPGAKDPVITWGQGFTLGIQFAASGSGKTVALQGTRDGINWTTITSLTMGASGGTSYHYTPVTNLWYRAVFAGTSDLAAATSNQVRTVVREIAVMRPTNFGHVRTISRNTSVTFTTTVRPARPELAPAKVSFWFYRQSGGSWVLAAKRDVLIDAAGLARTTFTFTSSGQWYVRSAANPTPYNANSVMSPVERYSVL
jgi:trimeric autotransporter adhesin